ncbi:hypothetical protein R5R35_005928 [Gryllus longicercus]|uniref:Mitotic-spindle organizing protein 1 n=1 Tax=Gryllus longicercus TaxID=2509291 RepID=A0AAN9VEX2_9ORTH
MANLEAHQVAEARECLHILLEISEMLHTGLDPETLSTCIRLIQCGVNPEALARVVIEIKRSVAEIKKSEEEDVIGRETVEKTRK